MSNLNVAVSRRKLLIGGACMAAAASLPKIAFAAEVQKNFAADPKHSVPEADRRIYAKAYAQPGGMRSGFEYFKAFSQDASDFEQFSKNKLTMPMLVLTGEKASGNFLIEQAKLVATDVKGVVVPGSGHWLMEEAPDTVIPAIIDFIN
jgi:pimeloyl-ACP methyl ester carboxylesterase